MLNRIFQLLLVTCLAIGTLWAGNDPFVGKWKLNPSKSKLTDTMKVEASGANKYVVDVGDGPQNVVPDGTDQPRPDGTTVSVTLEGSDTWKTVGKKDGHTLYTAIWKLSPDGNTLRDTYTRYQPDGSTSSVDYVFKRTAGSAGFPGRWESTSEKVNFVLELEIRPYEGDGLSLVVAAQDSTENIKFDGKDRRRLDERTLEIIGRKDGQISNTRQIKLSPDLKTLTMVQSVDQNKPSILVFDRE